ncbi:exonuclease RecJ [Clostridium sp. CAG:354]|jgi:single-stranded-DNA-specific exonuclease|nr:single-stranded-DNA-specific exonuclease RecJ [Clostridium sp.]CDE11405.1 exonuclease RecJ [Clostridium sp. CAG:354]
MIKKWEFYNSDEKLVDEICERYNLNKVIGKIIVNRHVVNDEDVRIFITPTRDDFHDPFLFKGMDIAVERIIKAINNKEKILIYGDYDVDGITSTTVLKKYLMDRGISVDTYIPNRLHEGYGLNKNAIDTIKERNIDLIITVDCGISAIEEVDYAVSLGMDVIVTDHHEVGEKLPNALAVIDAKRKDNTYPFRSLAGVGVVFKLIQALSIKLEIKPEEYLKYLDLVCVGTISDIVPLEGENRTIAKLGLMLIKVTRNLGLRELIKSSGYKEIDSNTISFGVAPRINACGRMGHEEKSLKLFLAEDLESATKITKELNEYNTLRQSTEKAIYEEAIQEIDRNHLDEKNSIVLGGKGWHHGVIGIVSSKVTDKYYKPSILLSFEDDIAKGSGRSVPGFDLYEGLTKCEDLLEKYGGHSMAVGLTLKKENLEKFKERFEQIAKEKNIKELVPIIYIDDELKLKDINMDLVKGLSILEPFGEANKVPLFLIRNLKIDSIRALSEGRHLKLTLRDENFVINAIGFELGYLAEEYRIGDRIDVVGTLEINSFNGFRSIQINMKDIRKSY